MKRACSAILFLFFISNFSFSQRGTIKIVKPRAKDTIPKFTKWEDVIVREINAASNGAVIFQDNCNEGGGEYVIDTRKNINNINDITKSELKKIKQIVFEYNGNVVYLDIGNKVWTEKK